MRAAIFLSAMFNRSRSVHCYGGGEMIDSIHHLLGIILTGFFYFAFIACIVTCGYSAVIEYKRKVYEIATLYCAFDVVLILVALYKITG